MRWYTETNLSPPKRTEPADDTLKADVYYKKASEGAGFIWQGDFQNAKQLLQAVQRRIDKTEKKKSEFKINEYPGQKFHRHRQMQSHRAQLLSRLLIYVDDNFQIPLRRAPNAKQALTEALDDPKGDFLISLRELLGIIGAHEWRKNGVYIPVLDTKIYPHYGLFSPIRGEYLDLIAQAPIANSFETAFDIGTGTGVIAAILAKRKVKKVIATDIENRAIQCATENIKKLELQNIVQIIEADLFPKGSADLIVCNPPWIPARPTSRLERAVYDEDHKMLKSFIAGAPQHLAKNGEVWLIISNIAEHLGLRSPDDIPKWIQNAGLKVIQVHETKPQHKKAFNSDDLIQSARQNEITKLWRLTFA